MGHATPVVRLLAFAHCGMAGFACERHIADAAVAPRLAALFVAICAAIAAGGPRQTVTDAGGGRVRQPSDGLRHPHGQRPTKE